MRRLTLLFIIILSGLIANAQDAARAQQLVREGVAQHDKGNYNAALDKYDEALKADKDNFDAWYEKGYTLYAQGKFKECVSLSKDMVKKFPDHPAMGMVYMQYGSALDDLGKSKDAMEIYDEAISKFPKEYLLYFNKGLTLTKLQRVDDALTNYQLALKLKPLHSSSNFYSGILLQKTNRVAALLSFMTFIAIEPQTARSKTAFELISTTLGGNVKKEGNNTTIYLDPSSFNKKSGGENDFSSVDMMMSLTSGLGDKALVEGADGKKDSVTLSPIEKLSMKVQLMIGFLAANKKDGKGFYWEKYVPFFEAMKEEKHVDVLAHLMYIQAGDADNKKWLEKNEDKVSDFYDWIKAYSWK